MSLSFRCWHDSSYSEWYWSASLLASLKYLWIYWAQRMHNAVSPLWGSSMSCWRLCGSEHSCCLCCINSQVNRGYQPRGMLIRAFPECRFHICSCVLWLLKALNFWRTLRFIWPKYCNQYAISKHFPICCFEKGFITTVECPLLKSLKHWPMWSSKGLLL